MRLLNLYNHLNSRLHLFPLQIKNNEIEKNYQKSSIERNLLHFKPFLLSIGILYFLFVIPDFLYIKEQNYMKLIITLRLVFSGLTVLIYYKSDYLLNYKNIYYTTTVYEIIGILIFLIIGYVYEPFSFTIQFLGLLIIILGIFFIVPNRLFVKMIVSVSFSIIFYFLFLFKTIPEQVELIAFIIYNVLIIFICTFSVYQINYLQRLNFLTNKKLEKMSVTDSLTGIYNRFKFDQELERQVNHTKRYDEKFSLIMFDIDDFKSINDKFGHLVGDKALVEIAGLVKNEVRKIDIFARTGGEEFIIILPRTELKDATVLAERLRKKIANYKFPGELNITCSFGVAQYKDEDNRNSIIERVDRFLYKAKANNKNCVCTCN